MKSFRADGFPRDRKIKHASNRPERLGAFFAKRFALTQDRMVEVGIILRRLREYLG